MESGLYKGPAAQGLRMAQRPRPRPKLTASHWPIGPETSVQQRHAEEQQDQVHWVHLRLLLVIHSAVAQQRVPTTHP